MKTVIIPDIHEHVSIAEACIDRLDGNYDQIVFLGDYFDDYGSPERAKTVEWLKHSIQKPNRIHLVGNHDNHYIDYAGNPFGVVASGFSYETLSLIIKDGGHGGLRSAFKKALLPAVFIDGWLISHAGFSNTLKGLENADADTLIGRARKALETPDDPLMKIGLARGGSVETGGFLWCDWNKEFIPRPNISQIVGHTKGRLPRFKSGTNSNNICLDTGLNHYAILENGKVSIHEIPHAA